MPGVFTQDDWRTWLSEPIRLRSRHALEQFNRNAQWFGIATSPFLRDWYRPLSEPVRSKQPLPRAADPYLFLGLKPQPEFSFAVTETGDTASLTFMKYIHKNRAEVSITEIRVGNLANVTITEIGPDR